MIQNNAENIFISDLKRFIHTFVDFSFVILYDTMYYCTIELYIDEFENIWRNRAFQKLSKIIIR